MSEDKNKGIIRTNAQELSDSLGLHVTFEDLYPIMKAQCFGGRDPSPAQMASFIVLANQYKLNPLTKEIYAFPSGGGITPIISIDGWIKIAHSSKDLRGIKHEMITDESGNVVAVKCIIARDGWEFHTETTEYMSENRRNTPTWKQYPIRMLKHRATAQAIRMAFNVNAMSEDEYEAMNDKQTSNTGNQEVFNKLKSSAENGMTALNNAYSELSVKDKQSLGAKGYADLKSIAESVEVIDV